MNKQRCEREDQTFAAVLSGTLDDVITLHAQQCPACSEILLVAGFMRKNDAHTGCQRTALPDPGLIWQEARSRANREALRVALRPIRFMKAMACVAFLCSPWFRLLLPIGRSVATFWSRVFDSSLVFLSKTSLSTPAEVTMMIGFSCTLILLGLSSWYMLRQE
jgi:predicted anti-sigma-YlaC factor YlaD